MTPFTTHALVSRWADGQTISEATEGDSLDSAVRQIDHRTLAILRITFDGSAWSVADVSEDAALMLLDENDGEEPDDINRDIRDFIDSHRPGDLQANAAEARAWSTQARGL